MGNKVRYVWVLMAMLGPVLAQGLAAVPPTTPDELLTVARDLKSSDPKVRLKALRQVNLNMDKIRGDSDILTTVFFLKNSDPDAKVQRFARILDRAYGSRNINNNWSHLPLAPGEYEAVNALIAAARDPEATDAYANAWACADETTKMAATEATAFLLDAQSLDSGVLKVYQTALATPGATRDAAARSLCCLGNGAFRNELQAEIDKLIASPEPDAHVMGAVIASWNDWGPARTVSADDIVKGVHHRLRWVRAVATDRMFRSPSPWPSLDGRTVLWRSLWGCEPDVAWDAMRRLNGNLDLNLPNLVYDNFRELDRKWAGTAAPGVAASILLQPLSKPVCSIAGIAIVLVIGTMAIRRRRSRRSEGEQKEEVAETTKVTRFDLR